MPPAVVLGIDFGGTKIAIAVGDLDGNRLGAVTIPAAAESGAAASLAAAIDAGRRLLARIAPGSELAALGVSTFGIPGPSGVALAPAIDGWADVPLDRELGAAFDRVPVRLVTDVKAAAQVEADRGALAGHDPAIYLNLGTGLAVAIVAGGSVVAGRHGASGEIGYNLRAVTDVGLKLEERTMLEDVVSGRALGSAQEVFAAAAHDPAAAALVETFTAELAFHLVNLAILVDPQRIAVGGGMTRSFDLMRPDLERALRAGVPYPPDLVLARYPHDAPLRGVLALAAQAAREPLGQQAPV